MDKFMKPSEVALLFRVSIRTVDRWCLEGKICAVFFGGRWLIDAEKLKKQWNKQDKQAK